MERIFYGRRTSSYPTLCVLGGPFAGTVTTHNCSSVFPDEGRHEGDFSNGGRRRVPCLSGKEVQVRRVRGYSGPHRLWVRRTISGSRDMTVVTACYESWSPDRDDRDQSRHPGSVRSPKCPLPRPEPYPSRIPVPEGPYPEYSCRGTPLDPSVPAETNLSAVDKKTPVRKTIRVYHRRHLHPVLTAHPKTLLLRGSPLDNDLVDPQAPPFYV